MHHVITQQCESKDKDLYDAVLNCWKTDPYGTCQIDANDNREDERAQEILQKTCNNITMHRQAFSERFAEIRTRNL